MSKKIAEEAKELAKQPIFRDNPNLKEENYLSTGSTLLNLELSGFVGGGFLKGCVYRLVGDSSSGKTFLSMTCFAEAAYNPRFQDYRLIYDDTENGCFINVPKLLGEKTADRVEAPSYIGNQPLFSTTIEEVYYNIDNAIKQDKPFIYVLDSMDAVSSEQANETFDKSKDAFYTGKEISGNYGDGKAKVNSQNMRRILHDLKRTGSIFIFISQTRDNLKSPFGLKTASGGRAAKFYVTAQIESTVKKTLEGLGVIAQLKIKKNRIDGNTSTLDIPIYRNYGIDDVQSCIEYLIRESDWSKAGGYVNTKGLIEGKYRLAELAVKIEEEEKYYDLVAKVKEVWDKKREGKTKSTRKPKYR